MILKLTLDLPEEQSCIRIVRLMGRALLEQVGAVEQDIDEVELVVGELCTNVVRHSNSLERRFRVGLEYQSEVVVVTVEDTGRGFEPGAIAPVGSERGDFTGSPDRIGGFGLQLVEGLSDSLQFERTDPMGTTVRAEKRLNFIPAPPALAAS